MFSDKVSGKSADREQLQEMLPYVREDDTLRVTSPDRLVRSTRDLLAMVEELKGRGVAVEFLDNPALNSDTPQSAFMLTILGAVAELERSVIRERQMEGIALARSAGKYDKGVRLTAEQAEDARRRVDNGAPKAAVARELGIKPPDALYRPQRGWQVCGGIFVVGRLSIGPKGASYDPDESYRTCSECGSGSSPRSWCICLSILIGGWLDGDLLGVVDGVGGALPLGHCLALSSQNAHVHSHGLGHEQISSIGLSEPCDAVLGDELTQDIAVAHEVSVDAPVGVVALASRLT